jgi:hypothetical protein
LLTWLMKGEMRMQMRSHAEVAQMLAEDIERALGRYRAAKRESAKTRPGSSFRLRYRDRRPCMPLADTQELTAILALSETLERHGEFVLGGRIPDDLRR